MSETVRIRQDPDSLLVDDRLHLLFEAGLPITAVVERDMRDDTAGSLFKRDFVHLTNHGKQVVQLALNDGSHTMEFIREAGSIQDLETRSDVAAHAR